MISKLAGAHEITCNKVSKKLNKVRVHKKK
jgi:hypothetical protein